MNPNLCPGCRRSLVSGELATHPGHPGRRSLEERFWSKVERRDPQDCWLWMGCILGGYGRFENGSRNVLAHRMAWKLINGLVPEGLCVLHKCDDRRCVNPTHLFLGTKADNNADMVRKGRQARGEAMGSAKLTWDAVRRIREMHASGQYEMRNLVELFGVHRSGIYRLLNGERWRGGPP